MATHVGAEHVSVRSRSHIPSMLDFRMLTTMAHPEYDYVMLMDDDLEFQEGAEGYYMYIFELLKRRPAVLSTFGSRYPIDHQTNPDNCIITTNRGLFIRMDLLLDFKWPELYGPCEEAVMGYHALAQDYHHIVVGEAPVTRSFVNHIEENSESPIHKLEDYETNVRAYIRTLYDDPSWEVLTGDFPKGIRNGEPQIRNEKSVAPGGLPPNFGSTGPRDTLLKPERSGHLGRSENEEGTGGERQEGSELDDGQQASPPPLQGD